jgi:hypothetical protein
MSTTSRVFSASGLRLAHSYASAFIAPTIVFFALSGALQVLDLHKAHGGYEPSPLIAAMARIHKDQILAPDLPPPGAGPPGFGPKDFGPPRGAEGGRPKPHMTLATKLLKGLFVFEALTLVATTLLGVWIGATHPKRARTFWIILAAGVLIPVALIAL